MTDRHKHPAHTLRVPPDDYEAQRDAAEDAGQTWSEWMLAAARQRLALEEAAQEDFDAAWNRGA